jgi:hypothetical protein
MHQGDFDAERKSCVRYGVIPPVYPTKPAPTEPALGQLDGSAGSAG